MSIWVILIETAFFGDLWVACSLDSMTEKACGRDDKCLPSN